MFIHFRVVDCTVKARSYNKCRPYIIFLNQISMRKRELAIPKNNPSARVLENFLESCLSLHLLFQTQGQSKPQSMIDNEGPMMSLVEHLFRHPSVQKQQTAERVQSKAYNNQTFFQTFNNTDISLNNEENQYSNYLKEYETVIKASRRKQYISPEKKNNEMKLLINQFLSDVSDVQEQVEANKQTQKTSSKIAKGHIKVEKIDLNAFHSIKLHKVQQTNLKERRSISNKQKNNNKQSASKLPNISQGKSKQKSQQNFNEKAKQKIQIQVKVIRKEEHPLVPPKVVSPLKIKDHHTAKVLQPAVPLDFRMNENHQMMSEGYSQTYLKKKTKNHEKTYAQSLHSAENVVPAKPKNGKKPLKIQIQLPLQEIQPEQIKKDQRVILEAEGTKIIKQISKVVSTLLNKSKNINGH